MYAIQIESGTSNSSNPTVQSCNLFYSNSVAHFTKTETNKFT